MFRSNASNYPRKGEAKLRWFWTPPFRTLPFSLPRMTRALAMMACGLVYVFGAGGSADSSAQEPEESDETLRWPGRRASSVWAPRPMGVSGWAAESILRSTPEAEQQPVGKPILGELRFQSPLSRFSAHDYPASGVRATDGLRLPANLASLYGIRPVELGREGTALKGMGLLGGVALFSGAMASSFGLMDEKTALWAVGGAAILGAAYGATWGYEKDSWREEWRWPEEETGAEARGRLR